MATVTSGYVWALFFCLAFYFIYKGTFTLLNIVYFLNDCFVFDTIGCSLKSLDLDSCTLSEILRLHILASGADVTSANAKYRYQKRGGFDATDDACMELRLSNPSLVKKLSSTSVYDLTPGKLQDGISNLFPSYPALLTMKLISQQETTDDKSVIKEN